MCDHCGCNAFPLIAAFTEEHRAIQAVAGALRRAVGRRDRQASRDLLGSLVGLLAPHVDAEERGLFAELRADEGIRETVEDLCAEHRQLEGALVSPSPVAPDWAPVLEALDRLSEHIYKEEYGVFPAAVVILPTPVWDRITPVAPDGPHDA